MDQSRNGSDKFLEEIEKLVKNIKDYDGRSGHAERVCMEEQQQLLYVLSRNPMGLHRLSAELKKEIEKIVKHYLDWSFNGYW